MQYAPTLAYRQNISIRSITIKATRISAPYSYYSAAFLLGLFLFLITIIEAKASSGVEAAGDVLAYVLPATSVGLTVYYKDGKGALQFLESAVLAIGVTHGLKYAVDETRPNGGRHSFPSGHSSVSFSAAEFIRKRYGWEYGIPAYAAASFVAYSRVDARQHYLHDVLVGAGIGVAGSYIFTKPYKEWNVQPEADGGYVGVRLGRAW